MNHCCNLYIITHAVDYAIAVSENFANRFVVKLWNYAAYIWEICPDSGLPKNVAGYGRGVCP